jgi:hypothetical protein
MIFSAKIGKCILKFMLSSKKTIMKKNKVGGISHFPISRFIMKLQESIKCGTGIKANTQTIR